MRNPAPSPRLALTAAGLLVAALVGVLWWSMAPASPPDGSGMPLLPHAGSASDPSIPATDASPSVPAESAQLPEEPVVPLGASMILVRVLDAETRAPVTAFQADVLPHDGTPALARATDPLARSQNSTPVRNPGGLFKVEQSAGTWDLVVRAPGFRPGVIEGLAVPPADNQPAVLLLSHGPSLAGLVVDDEGQPVTDVAVFLAVESLAGDGRPPETTVCRTDGFGRFRFSPLAPGLYGLALLDPGNRDDCLGGLVVGEGATDVTLRLAARHNIVVAVQDPAGRPVPGADVELRGPAGLASARTLDSGQAHLRYLSDGTYELSVTVAGFQRQQQDVVLSGGQGEQVRWITLQPDPGS